MSVKIEIIGENGADAATKISDFIGALGARFQSVPLGVPTATNAPTGTEAPAVEAPKSTRSRKPAAEQKPTEQPAAQDPTPLEKAVEATKQADKPAEQPKSDEKTFDEAACRANLQKLHSVITSKKDSPSGIQAAQGLLTEFGVKKVSELKPEQYKPFCERIEAAITEAGK